MTHVPEIDAENPYQNTGTINRHENRALSYSLPKTGTRIFGTHLHVRRSRNRYRFSGSPPVSAPISGTCVIGIISASHPDTKSDDIFIHHATL